MNTLSNTLKIHMSFDSGVRMLLELIACTQQRHIL